jgi:hypothetical protein
MAEKLPDNFDWVAERFKCSAAAKLAELHRLVEQNVVTRNQQVGPTQIGPIQRFSINVLRTDPLFFKVSDTQRRNGVDFSLQGDTIRIEDASTRHVSLTLDNEGRCKLVLDGEELDSWQLLKRALEPLFFGDK